MNFGPLTPEITRLMFTHPKSIVRVLRMLMHLCAGHVTLLPGEFHPSKFLLQSDLGRRADSRWALPQISSFFLFPLPFHISFLGLLHSECHGIFELWLLTQCCTKGGYICSSSWSKVPILPSLHFFPFSILLFLSLFAVSFVGLSCSPHDPTVGSGKCCSSSSGG